MLPSRSTADAGDHSPLLEAGQNNQRSSSESSSVSMPVGVPSNWGQGILSWLWRTPERGSSNDLHTSLTSRTPSSSSDVQAPLLTHPTRPVPSNSTRAPSTLASHSLEALPSSISSSASLAPTPFPSPLTLTTSRLLPPPTRPSPEITPSSHSRTNSAHSIASIPESPHTQPSLKSSPLNPSNNTSRSPSPSPHSPPDSPSAASMASLTRTNSSSSGPQCMICLEPLTADDFEDGEAIVLECLCKGDNALRHRSCALKWLQFKGDRTCDVCKTPIGNLPDPPPRPPSPPHTIMLQIPEPLDDVVDLLTPPEAAAAADHVFDTIRVTWVAMIFCILFFQLSVGQAFLVGAAVGMLYTTVCMLVHRYCQRQAAAQEAAARAALGDQEAV